MSHNRTIRFAPALPDERRDWLRWAIACCCVLLGLGVLPASAQDAPPTQVQEPQVQEITAHIQSGGEIHVYRVAGLAPGDVLHVSLRATAGNLDPLLAVLEGDADLRAVQDQYQADLEQLLAAGGDIAPGLEDVRNRYFLQWDDDSGPGYAAALAFPIETAGDYQLLAGASLSALGRQTWGDYILTVGVNAPQVLTGEAQANGASLAVRDRTAVDTAARVSELTGTISAAQPPAVLELVNLDAGDTLQVFVAATSGDLRPTVLLRDFGGKPLAAVNLSGEATRVAFEQPVAEPWTGYTVEILGAPSSTSSDGERSAGEFRAVVGINAPAVLNGEASVTEAPALKRPIAVQLGVKIDRISEVDSTGEDFTVIGSLRMDWQDPQLAFSPDACSCSVKLYTEREFDRFLAEVQSRWPDFTFFNQQANRWTQNRAAAVWPDGRARYIERFTTTFQADFDFRLYPFDVQEFPIVVDMILPDNVYQLTPLPGYTAISAEHGEDEFVIGPLESENSAVAASTGADRQISRMTFSFGGPRHLNYYILQIFTPILLIILISWFTFFLKDYGRRIEAAAANVLLFIAFSFSLASNYPRLGYVTFLDAVMAVTFVVNTLVLLYNVQLKRMESKGEIERVERIDRFFDWAYPLSYLLLIGLVALLFFGPFQTT